MMGCVCLETDPLFLSADCPRMESHEQWLQGWFRDHPRARIQDVPRYPRGTFHVKQRCLCRGESRYYSVRCSGVDDHGVWADQDWYGEPPVFEEGYMIGAKLYHEEIMEAARRLRAEGLPEPREV